MKFTSRRAGRAQRVFLLSKRFPKGERYSLTDQIRRSSRAVCGMIAEAWGRRRDEAAFISKLTEAIAEAMETQSWLDAAIDASYIDAKEQRDHDLEWQNIGGRLNRMIERASTFCPGR